VDGGEAMLDPGTSAPIPDGMRRQLGVLRAEGSHVPLVELARRLLALDGAPSAPIARRLIAGLFGARPDALPEALAPLELRPIEESAVAATPLAHARFAVVDIETTGSRARTTRSSRSERSRRSARGDLALRDAGPAAWPGTAVGGDRRADRNRRSTPRAGASRAPRARELRALARRGGRCAVGGAQRALRQHVPAPRVRRAGRARPAVAVLCTQRLARRLLPRLGRYDLDHVCAQFGVRNHARHRALGDADATARVWIELLALAAERGVETVGDLLDLQEQPVVAGGASAGTLVSARLARARKLLLALLGAAVVDRDLARRTVLVPARPGAVERAAHERTLRLLLAVLVVGDSDSMALALGVVLLEAQLAVRIPLLRDAVLSPAAVLLAARARCRRDTRPPTPFARSPV
jgi:DNA polymerase III epsilon subunit-like protein